MSKFEAALHSNDYAQILKVFNEKTIARSIGNFFGFNNNSYCKTIISLMKGEYHDELVEAMALYLPEEIER